MDSWISSLREFAGGVYINLLRKHARLDEIQTLLDEADKRFIEAQSVSEILDISTSDSKTLLAKAVDEGWLQARTLFTDTGRNIDAVLKNEMIGTRLRYSDLQDVSEDQDEYIDWDEGFMRVIYVPTAH